MSVDFFLLPETEQPFRADSPPRPTEVSEPVIEHLAPQTDASMPDNTSVHQPREEQEEMCRPIHDTAVLANDPAEEEPVAERFDPVRSSPRPEHEYDERDATDSGETFDDPPAENAPSEAAESLVVSQAAPVEQSEPEPAPVDE